MQCITNNVRVGSIEVAYDEFGRDGSSPRPFVLVHGLTGHRRDWEIQRAFLASHGRNLAPDLRGHGDSTNTGDPSTYTFAQLVEDLRGFLDAAGIESCDLLGHSVGGMVALRFVLEYPERVASLVAMNTTPEAPEGYERWIFERGGQLGREKGMAELQRTIETVTRQAKTPASERHLANWPVDYWEHHRMRYATMDPNAYEYLALAMVDQESLAPRLGEIACPTLVLVGEDDTEYLPGAELLVEGIAGARRVIVPRAGHHPHQENSEAWREAIAAHLERVRDGSFGKGAGS